TIVDAMGVVMTKRIDPALLTPVSGEITLVTDAAAAAKPKDGMVTSSTTAMLSVSATRECPLRAKLECPLLGAAR
ncbi:MAG: hypothetical protein WAL15_06175, partial [Xanthobacteraceae bacterium]